MTIRHKCPCGQKLSIKDEMAGRRVKCPSCQATFTVPKPATSVESGGPAPEASSRPERAAATRQRTPDKASARGTAGARGAGRTAHRTAAKAKPGSNRKLLMYSLMGVAVVVLAAGGWMFWPSTQESESNVTASSSPQENVQGAAAIGVNADASTPSSGPVSNPSATATDGTPPVVESASAPGATQPQALTGDLGLMQGIWQVVDLKIDANQPTPPAVLEDAKQRTFTFEGDLLFQRSNSAASGRRTAVSLVQLDSTQALKTLDLQPLTGGPEPKTVLAVYGMDQEKLTICLSPKTRPVEMKPDASLQQVLFTLERETSAGSNTSVRKNIFDFAAWRTASQKLQAMNVFVGLDDQEIDLADHSTFMAIVDMPELVDGQIPAEFWTIVAPVSHLALRTKTTTVITDQTLTQMSQHKGLLGLNVSGPFNVTPDGLGKLRNCPDFRMLLLHDKTPISPELLDAISQIAELRGLAIGDRPMTPNVVPAVLRLKNLESLSLRATGIVDADIAQLGSLTKLQFLDLDQSKMTDEGLQSLNGLTSLRLLDIRGSNVSQQVLSDFQATHPQCRILK